MSQTNNAHEALVRKLAEEFMIADNPLIELLKSTTPGGDNDIRYDQGLGTYIPAARIAVKHMAGMFKWGYWLGNKRTSPTCTDIMIEHGLIPSPEKQKEKETCTHPDIGTDGGGDYCKKCKKRW